MFFCYRSAFDFKNNTNNSYKLGYAYSENLETWIRDDNAINFKNSNESWDNDMFCYPNVFEVNNDIYMLYNGNLFVAAKQFVSRSTNLYVYDKDLNKIGWYNDLSTTSTINNIHSDDGKIYLGDDNLIGADQKELVFDE